MSSEGAQTEGPSPRRPRLDEDDAVRRGKCVGGERGHGDSVSRHASDSDSYRRSSHCVLSFRPYNERPSVRPRVASLTLPFVSFLSFAFCFLFSHFILTVWYTRPLDYLIIYTLAGRNGNDEREWLSDWPL